MTEKDVNAISKKEISRLLIEWYELNMRNLPWRETNDPYKIWVSEVILQQTRVDQGLSYYRAFIEKFPTVTDLANSSEKRVLKAWQGLGYYSRARNLHEAAKDIVSLFDGKLPNTYKDVISLKGIGVYTAAAILSIAYNKPYAVVDGNVYRVLSRLFKIETPIDSTAGKKEFSKHAQELLDVDRPGMHNQAIMEFGALQCTPSNPLCDTCPLQYLCSANEFNLQTVLPIKSKKVTVRKRYFHYFLLQYDNSVFLNKRVAKDIWKNMYELPLIETDSDIDMSKLMQTKTFKTLFNDTELTFHSYSKQFKHILTHQHIYAKFYVADVTKINTYIPNNFIKVSEVDISKYPIPRLIHRYLDGE